MDETAVAKAPIIASYVVRVTVRSADTATAPAIKDVEKAVEDAVVDLSAGLTSVRASAERTDR